MSRGNPLKLIYPTDGTLAVPSPSAIPKNAPHPAFMAVSPGSPQGREAGRRQFQ
jgi:iron(III) transport system substrate-binding protein